MQISILDIGQIVLLLLIISSALYAIKTRDLLVATVSLASMSLLLSLEFYILEAPDVAIAEAGIGAGLTTAIYILAIKRTERTEGEI